MRLQQGKLHTIDNSSCGGYRPISLTFQLPSDLLTLSLALRL